MTAVASPPAVTIEITDAMVDRAVASLLRGVSYDEDGDHIEVSAVDVPRMVRNEVAKRIDREVCIAIQETARDVVATRVVEILDRGFPVYSQWGEQNGTKTLPQVVGEAVFKKDGYNDSLATQAHKHMARCVESIVRDHVKSLDVDIRTSMKASAAEALAKWMASTLGVKP